MDISLRQRLKLIYRIGLVIVAIVLAFTWQQIQTSQSVSLNERNVEYLNTVKEPIQPLSNKFFVNQAKFHLGEQLFREPRLSRNNAVSCATCHNLDQGGADNKQYSVGLNGAITDVNTPTVFNVAYNFRFNWDGEHENLAVHTDKLMQNPNVMGSQWSDVEQTLEAINKYRQAFEAVYTDGINKNNVIDAIVTYESALTTPNAPFDQYLMGNQSALSAAEKQGYTLFKAYGCVSCHHGMNVGGNMFQQFGVIGNYFEDRGNVQKADLGRFNVTKDEADRHVFRVPSLRNVAVTPPYLHDGTAETLEEAVRIMVKYQLGRPIPSEHVNAIVQFLKTLTGEYDSVPLQDMANVMVNQ
ncbi:MAG: cytochrome c peroxidase [Cyanobacteria bacterium P01_H01_bin.21]